MSLKSRLANNTHPSKKEMMEFCKERLPYYMASKIVVFKDDLSKTSTHKIQKFVLRDIANSLG